MQTELHTTANFPAPAYTPPESTGFKDLSATPFAQLMEASKQQQRHEEQTGVALYASAADPGGDERKRQQRYLGKSVIQEVHESVNCVEIPSEKRQTGGSAQFSGGENAEQRFRGQSSSANQQYSRDSRNGQSPNNLTYHNNKEIAASTFASTPSRTHTGETVAAVTRVPEPEMKKLVRVLRNTSLSKRASVFLTLDLKELGEVKLDVTLKGKKVFITAHIADRRAAAALSFAVGELKRQLAGIDLSLEKFEISKRHGQRTPVSNRTTNGATVSVHTGIR